MPMVSWPVEAWVFSSIGHLREKLHLQPQIHSLDSLPNHHAIEYMQLMQHPMPTQPHKNRTSRNLSCILLLRFHHPTTAATAEPQRWFVPVRGYKSNFDAGKVAEWNTVTLPIEGFTDFWDDATGEAIKTCQEWHPPRAIRSAGPYPTI